MSAANDPKTGMVAIEWYHLRNLRGIATQLYREERVNGEVQRDMGHTMTALCDSAIPVPEPEPAKFYPSVEHAAALLKQSATEQAALVASGLPAPKPYELLKPFRDAGALYERFDSRFMAAAETYRQAFKKRVAAWNTCESYSHEHPHAMAEPDTKAEAEKLIKAYRDARDEFQAADLALGQFLTGDEPLA